jgi:type IV secretion system protein VirD4
MFGQQNAASGVHARLAGERGLYLGRFLDAKTHEVGDKLIYPGDRHQIFFGPTGSGKSARFLLPNLLGDYLAGQSVIVIDPKAELASCSAMWRHKLHGPGSVKILDPFGKLHEIAENRPDLYGYLLKHGLTQSAGFNPLDALDPDADTFYDDAAAIGEALIKIEGNDPHWPESAQGLVTGLVMWEKLRWTKLGNPLGANLENVREMLTEADEFTEYVREDGTKTRVQTKGLAATAAQMAAEGGYEIASLAGRFTMATKEIASIQSTADTQTRWLLSQPLRRDLKRQNGIDFAELKQRPITVYVILPAEYLRTQSTWMRLVVVSALRALYRKGKIRTTIFLEEMATAIGRLGPLEDAFGLVRGYRVQLVGILQDLAQLQTLYRERWESFLANAGVIQGFAPNDLTTVKWMSERSGEATGVARSLSEASNVSERDASHSKTESWNQFGRAAYLRHDLFGLEEGTGVLWIAGESNTVRFDAEIYDKLRVYRERALPNPYYEPA